MALTALSSATNVLTNVLSTAADITHLGDVPGLVANVPLTFLLVGHCLAIAGMTKGRWGGSQLLSFVQGFLFAYGGSVASNLFLGNATSHVLFQDNEAILIWAAAWWIVNHNPLELVSQALDLAPVGIVARACMQVLRAGLVAAQVNYAAKTFPGLIAPAVIAGALAGSGGKIATDILSTLTGLRVSFEVAAPSYALRSALVGSSAQYLLVHVLHALTPAQGEGLLIVIYLSHTLSDDLLGSAYDYTIPLIETFTTVTLISVPKAPAARGRGRAPAAATAATGSAPSTPRSVSKGRTPSRRKRATE